MNIDNEILNLINNVGDNFPILNYVYNGKKFDPDKSWIYYSGPFWDQQELVAAIRALLTGKWISSGENVHKFEIEFCKKNKQGYGVMVNSGSSADLLLIASLKKYFGWKDNDEIIISPSGFPSTLSAITINNLKPIFVDIEFETLNFDLNLIEEKITKNTRGIFVSPILGNPPDFDNLIDICEKFNLKLILDNCDSMGSEWNGKLLNEYAIASAYSFYPAHHISTGEGGLISSNIKEIVDIARSMAWWGRDCYCVGSANILPNGTCQKRFGKWLAPVYNEVMDHKYFFTQNSFNLKPLDLQGAIGLVQLSKLDEIHEKRKINKERISNIFLKNIPTLKVPFKYELADVSWFGTPFICESKEQKQELVVFLEKNRIQTRNYFSGSLLLHPAYSFLDDYKKYPNSNKVLDLVFFIGCHPAYDETIFDYIENILKGYKN